MKINVFALITVVCISVLISYASSTDLEISDSATYSAATKKNVVLADKTLKNPIRIYNLNKEKVLTAKVRFVMHSSINKDPKSPQNIFDYKLVQINDEHMIVYKVDQSLTQYDEKTVNSSKYLMTMKLENIDLLCNGHLFLCTLGEFKREYKHKMKHIDFTTAKEVTNILNESVASKKCVIITFGLFHKLNDVGYLCFDDIQDTYFFLDLLSERILKRYKTDFEGQLRLVNQVIY